MGCSTCGGGAPRGGNPNRYPIKVTTGNGVKQKFRTPEQAQVAAKRLGRRAVITDTRTGKIIPRSSEGSGQ